MSDSSKVSKGRFRPQKPPASITFGINLFQEVEQRDDGPWLVVYVSGRKVGEVPIEPGTEPKLKRAKVLDFPHTAPSDDDRSPHTRKHTDA